MQCNFHEHLMWLYLFSFLKTLFILEAHMNRDIQLDQDGSQIDRPLPLVTKRKLDLVILRYIARRVYVALRSLERATTTERPLLYYLDERHKRTHRMAIYNP